MKMRTKLCLLFSVLLWFVFVFGISDRGQRYLIGSPASDHWQRDDQYMGAALAPYVYCLMPAVLLILVGGVFYLRDRRRS
jgi:hypothetical protein